MKIAFYFPYPEIGGVPLLFLKVASYLADKHEVYLVDMDCGYMKKRLPSNCKFISYENPERLPDDCVVVFQSCPFWRIPYLEKFNDNIKVYYWNLHPENINANIFNSSLDSSKVKKVFNCLSLLRRGKLRSLLRILVENDSISFMDLENKIKTEIQIKERIERDIYLPIITSADCNAKFEYRQNIKSDILNCLFVGRMDSYKVELFIYTIKQIALLDRKFHFTVIGNGDSITKVLRTLDSADNISYYHIKEVEKLELFDIIRNQNVAFGMGTSALDSASQGIPTVMLDYSYVKIDMYDNFRFIYESEGYTLAKEATHTEGGGHSIFDILNILDKDAKSISDQCKNYYIENHSITKMDMFPKLLSNSKTTIKELKDKKMNTPDIITSFIVKIFSKYKIDESGFINF
ncbi:hypothetical protein AB6D56_15470 [Vibrio lentus]